MRNTLYVLIIFNMFFRPGFAKIPDVIFDYLNHNKGQISLALDFPFNDKELALIVQRMAEKLLARYGSFIENSATTKKELLGELIQYISSDILNPDTHKKKDKPKKDSQSEKKSLANREVAEKILKIYSGSFEDNILRINYNGTIIPLKIKTSEKGIRIILPGAPLPLPDNFVSWRQCLDLKFMRTSQIYDIEWLGSLETVCPLPVENGQGTYLLMLAEDIARALEIPHLRLNDFSEVLCVKDLVKTSLRLLRMWEKKKNWYESKGYKPATPQVKELLQNQAKQLRALTLNDFQMAIKEINSAEKPIFIEKLEKYKKVVQQGSPYLADFMAWLWSDDCSAYNAIFRIFKLYNRELDEEILIDDDIWLKKNL